MFYYFPGNYTWSLAVHTSLRLGAQIGEIDRGCRHLLTMENATADDWAAAWESMASQQATLAARDIDRGYRISAGERLVRAAIYQIQGERQVPPGDLKTRLYTEHLSTFQRAVELAELPFQRVEVPSPDGPLPGYFISSGRPGPSPTMIFFDGFDTSKEIMSLTIRNHLARRGLHCLVMDSPGVGEPLRLRGVPSRPDYEVPAGAVIDYLESRADVDAERIGVMAISLGGYYAPRAAAFEKRIKACVAWGAVLDYGELWRRRWETRSATVSVPFWQLPWVMGTPTMEAALERVQAWDLTDALPSVSQPLLILHGEHDKQVPLADAQRSYELAGSSDKELRVFTEAEGGAEHCMADEPQAAIQFIADWSAEKLGRISS